ncbi:hypothetical protein D3C86_1460310 [compost metagenome]
MKTSAPSRFVTSERSGTVTLPARWPVRASIRRRFAEDASTLSWRALTLSERMASTLRAAPAAAVRLKRPSASVLASSPVAWTR